MSCPKYVDYTRECIATNEGLAEVASFDFCNSDEYEECPFYKIIEGKVIPCEFIEKCKERQELKPFDFETIKRVSNDFCLSKNKVNCEVYKLYKSGKDVPNGLGPDGSMLKIDVKE